MIEARPSMTEPSAQPIKEMEEAWMPATRPTSPSAVIQRRENQDSARMVVVSRSHSGDGAAAG